MVPAIAPRLPSLRHRADRRTLVFLAAHAVSMGAAFLLRERLPFPVTVVWIAVLCAQAFATAVITHNTVHVPMFESGRANRWMQVAISLLYGNSVSVFVRGHNYSHHRYTQSPKDLMRTTKARFRWNLLNQLFFLAIVGPAIERGNHVFIRIERERATRWYRQFSIERWAVRIFTVLALLIDWRSALLFVLIPRLFGIWAIAGINYAQHDGCDADHPHNHSRNFVGRPINWFLFNNGFHTIHHDEPQAHWSILRELHDAKVAPHIHPALDQASLLGFCWRQYVWPGKRLRYDGEPVVLPPPQPDEPWIPDTLTLEKEISVGAAGGSV